MRGKQYLFIVERIMEHLGVNQEINAPTHPLDKSLC